MSMTVFVPGDAAARALGADAVADAVLAEAAARGVPVRLIRNGTRGMIWLEPLVEIADATGRRGFGPMSVADVPALFSPEPHPKALGRQSMCNLLNHSWICLVHWWNKRLSR